MTVFRTARGRTAPVGRKEMDVRADELVPHMHIGEGDRGDQKSPLVLGGASVWDHQVGGSGFRGCGFDTRVCYLFRLPSNQLRGCCGFWIRIQRPVRLPGCGHFRLLIRFRDRLCRGIWNRAGGVVALRTCPLERRDSTSPRSICSTEGPARCSFAAVRWGVAALFRRRSGACFASASFASFHITQPR
jgi:hypothetical protein